ncbi:lasso peptide biosynthesis B2 protein [Streptomyces hainanensis]|uniref:Lasso peptide biosynthesis B2 protein n=1 Tax=Streptomyces hainanensis TaxID=402648 RepID=A0A4R4TL07_9ACTN|nr:lasso peptide biosynthesis B2 protein [Streptomyces hainanensis]TDC76434.1 lasso peptide biosynthesis B2 protein [Streptomyces hainanensis]
MSQILDAQGVKPPLQRRLAVHAVIVTARALAHLPPRRIRAILTLLRRRAAPASYAQAQAARREVTATSTLCSGRYCLQRSLAATLLCRLQGTWPTWHTGVRMPPFAAHAWIEAEGRPVDEPADTITYRPIITIPPSS